MYGTAEGIGKGERFFITVQLPDYVKVGNDDLIEKYFSPHLMMQKISFGF